MTRRIHLLPIALGAALALGAAGGEAARAQAPVRPQTRPPPPPQPTLRSAQGPSAPPTTPGQRVRPPPLRPLVGPGPTTNLAREAPTQELVTPPALGNVEPPGVAPPSRAQLAPMTPEAIANAQLALQGFGLYRGPVNGLYTGPTRAALLAFQQARSLPATGLLDGRSARALGLESQSGRLVDPARREAIADFQVRAGLAPTGELDEATLAVINEELVPVDENGIPTVRFRTSIGPTVLP